MQNEMNMTYRDSKHALNVKRSWN